MWRKKILATPSVGEHRYMSEVWEEKNIKDITLPDIGVHLPGHECDQLDIQPAQLPDAKFRVGKEEHCVSGWPGNPESSSGKESGFQIEDQILVLDDETCFSFNNQNFFAGMNTGI